MMAQSQSSRVASRTTMVVVFCVCCLVGIGPYTLPSKHNNSSEARQHSCQQCLCDCLSESLFAIIPTECGKDVPKLKEDLLTLTTEELSLLKTVANETLVRTEALILHAGVASSHYQSEAEKCNVAVETCEEARERAESRLIEERRLSALWEERARSLTVET